MLTPNFLPSFPWSFVFKIKLKINNVEAIRLKVQDFQEIKNTIYNYSLFPYLAIWSKLHNNCI